MATGLTSELTTGISELDLQHGALLELIAGAAAVIESGRAAAARQSIAEIADGFYHHFASEEMLMEASDYPETRAHKTAHRLFLHYLDLNLRLEAQGGLLRMSAADGGGTLCRIELPLTQTQPAQ